MNRQLDGEWAPRLVAVVGATASGKTSLGVGLAQRFSGEIVSADSRQVYRWMNIGTAKPAAEELAAAPHHLIDIVSPDEDFSLGLWLEATREVMEDVWARGKLPLLVGGTGQYVWALLEGWQVPQVPPQSELRRELAQESPGALFEELQAVDPEAALVIDPRNIRRIVRALEVCTVTGERFSTWKRRLPPDFRSLVIGLRWSREDLYRRIDSRVDHMIADGLVEEVRGLMTAGYSGDLPSMSAAGYKEMVGYLSGEIDLGAAVKRTKESTHRLARHQHAWFKESDSRIRWIDGGERAADEAAAAVRKWLQNDDQPDSEQPQLGRAGIERAALESNSPCRCR